MVYTIDSILSNPAFITAVINRALVTLNAADAIDWPNYLNPAGTNPDGTFKTYFGNQTAVVVGSFIDKNSNKPIRQRHAMQQGMGEVNALGETYQMDNDRLDQLQILVDTLNRLGNQQAMEDVVNFLADDFRQCVLAPNKRMDLMLNDLKFTGKAESRSKVDEKGVKLTTITLPFKEGKNLFTPTAENKGAFLSFLENILPTLRQNGSDATIMEMSRTTFRKCIVGDDEFAKSFIAKFGSAQFNPGALASPDMFNQLFENLQIPLIVRIKEVNVKLQDATMLATVPDYKISLLPNERIGFLRHRRPYELADRIPSKTYTVLENDHFVATERTKEGRTMEYGAEWIVDINQPKRMGLIDLSAFKG